MGSRFEFQVTTTSATGTPQPPAGVGWQRLDFHLVHTPAGPHWTYLWGRKVGA